ncbi:MAG TPA: biotin--[acetyl-CoA-carboxylase] ligase [Candidatus Limnocylindrales bacterium]|nr:biotin--[acetyl-CoA-carboxylase] ligase [Candidatus Limnocylindrales bacterium]
MKTDRLLTEAARRMPQRSQGMISTAELSVEALRSHLGSSRVGQQLYLFGELPSTNDTLRDLARKGAGDGTVVVADEQTAGRGRFDRPWYSPPGVNLHVSVLFRPAFHPREAMRFSFIASLALTDALAELGLSPAIKWPNDVLLTGKKVAGSFVECATRGDEIDFLILGMGVNVNVEVAALREALGPAGLYATSIREVAGSEVDRNMLGAAYLGRLDAWAARYRSEGAEPILTAWRDRDIVTGCRIEARGTANAVTGRALGVDGLGHLVLQISPGHRVTVLSEQIRIVE